MDRFPCFYCQHLDLITENFFSQKPSAKSFSSCEVLALTLDLLIAVRQLFWERGHPFFRRQRNTSTLPRHLYAKLASSLRQGFLFMPCFVDFTTCKEYASL